MSEINYFFPHTNTPISEEAAKLRHEGGLDYGLNIKGKAGVATCISVPGHCVLITLYDPHMRNTWAIIWGPASAPEASDELEIQSFTASCCAKEIPDPKRAPTDVWLTVIMRRKDGAYMVRYACPATGGLTSVDKVLSRRTLPYPAFGDFSPFLDFDYSAFEEAAQDHPPEFHSKGVLPRIPGIQSWNSPASK